MFNFLKKPVRVRTKQKTKTYTAFSLGASEHEKVLRAARSQNCWCSNGVLSLGVRYVPTLLPDGQSLNVSAFSTAISMVYELSYEQDGDKKSYFYVDANRDMYVFDLEKHAFELFATGVPNQKAVAFYDKKYAQAVALIGEEGVAIYHQGTLIRLTTQACLPVGCFAKGRLFYAHSGRTITYCMPFDVQEMQKSIDDCGEIRLPDEQGEIVALAALADEVYVFCQYGIFSMQVSGSARNFKIQKIQYNGGSIFGESVCAVMNGQEKIFFTTSQGVCCLCGTQIHRLGMLDDIQASDIVYCRAVVIGGEYWTSFIDRQQTGRALLIDTLTQQTYPADFAQAATQTLGKTLCLKNGKICEMRLYGDEDTQTKGVFEVQGIDFGNRKEKTIRNLTFLGTGQFTLTCKSNRSCKHTVVTFCNGLAVVPMYCKGTSFTLRFELNGGSMIKSMQAELTTLLEVDTSAE